MYNITLSEEIKRHCPEYRGAAVFAEVTNSTYNESLWQEIAAFTQDLKAHDTTDSIKNQPVIAATREAYKRCGKDPSRYRPSAEALRRRLLRGLELYQIDTLVDLINLVSLRTGHSIGGFDADKIEGTSLELGIGRTDEPFEGIGRGVLNIEDSPSTATASEVSVPLPATMSVPRWISIPATSLLLSMDITDRKD